MPVGNGDAVFIPEEGSQHVTSLGAACPLGFSGCRSSAQWSLLLAGQMGGSALEILMHSRSKVGPGRL